MTITFEATLSDYDDLLTVTGEYYTGKAGSMYKRNGDPGDPPEPEEFCIDSVYLNNTDITDRLSDDEQISIEEQAFEYVSENDEQ